MDEEKTVEKKRRRRAAPKPVDDPFAAEWLIPDPSDAVRAADPAVVENTPNDPDELDPIHVTSPFIHNDPITGEYTWEENRLVSAKPLDAAELEQELKASAQTPAWPVDENTVAETFVPSPFEPEDAGTNARRFGLAFSAGIVFFSSIAFMLVIGWIADLLLGSSPWGLVGGIVFGSIIGFVQFFSISSRIFKKDETGSAVRPLLSHADEDPPSIDTL